MLTPHHLKSFSVPLSTRPLTPAVTSSRVSTIHQHHNDVDMVAERCVLGDTQPATDEDLQKLGKPPVYSGKEDEWSEWSFVMKSYASLLSAHVPALLTKCREPSNEPRHEHCGDQSHNSQRMAQLPRNSSTSW